nr:MAG TPA: hypothetical protein [Caudoviricetes sp.]
MGRSGAFPDRTSPLYSIKYFISSFLLGIKIAPTAYCYACLFVIVLYCSILYNQLQR